MASKLLLRIQLDCLLLGEADDNNHLKHQLPPATQPNSESGRTEGSPESYNQCCRIYLLTKSFGCSPENVEYQVSEWHKATPLLHKPLYPIWWSLSGLDSLNKGPEALQQASLVVLQTMRYSDSGPEAEKGQKSRGSTKYTLNIHYKHVVRTRVSPILICFFEHMDNSISALPEEHLCDKESGKTPSHKVKLLTRKLLLSRKLSFGFLSPRKAFVIAGAPCNW